MCWGLGITISSAVVRGVASIDSNWGWRLPFALQWIWPVPLIIGVYLAPESPWSCVRRGKLEQAITSIRRLGAKDETEEDFQSRLAYMIHTTNIEKAETGGASFLECFKGTNLRRTEINCVIWGEKSRSSRYHHSGADTHSRSNALWKRHPRIVSVALGLEPGFFRANGSVQSSSWRWPGSLSSRRST